MATNAVRGAALGGVVGPVAFVGSWSALGAGTDGYSALHDPISDLAGAHASTRVVMTAGFVVFSAGMGLYAWSLHRTLPGSAWTAAAATGAATVGVAAFPLNHSDTVDTVHGVFAGIGYATLAATALLSVAPLAQLGVPGWTGLAFGTGAVSSAALALTLVGSYGGFFQRLGLTAGDVFVVASAIAINRGVWDRVP